MIDLTDFHRIFSDSVEMPADFISPTIQKLLSTRVKEVVANPYGVSDLLDPEKNVRLFLTNIRTFQQYASEEEKEQYKLAMSESRARKRGKQFYVRTTPPKFCRSYRIAFLNFSKGQLQNIQFTSVACKSWTCPACCTVKALSVKYKLREIIIDNKLDYFLTLTLDPAMIPADFLSEHRNRTHRYITKLFNHFLTVLRRKSFRYFNKAKNKWETYQNSREKITLRYVWVMEFQKNGNAHLHILLNQYVPIDIIREIWTHVGGGHIMKVEKVKTLQGISHYLTNYIVKGIKNDNSELSGFKYFERRYSVSKTCIKNKPIFGNIETSPEIKEYIQNRGLAWINNYLYNSAYTDLIINFTGFSHE